MKYELMNPEYIVYSLFIIIIIMFAWKKKDNYKKGIIVANTKYVKNTGYYKRIMVKYRVYSILVFIFCISLIILGGILSARIFTRESKEEVDYNRDIIFCMDGDTFTDEKQKVIGAMKDIILGLKNERIGIVAFNTSAVTVLPLTTSYDYAIQILDGIYKDAELSNFFINTFLSEGTQKRGTGSFTGDGLASCAMSFKNDEKRTKIIVFLSITIKDTKGGSYIKISEAGDICKDAGIVVYPISVNENTACAHVDFPQYRELANKTGGKFYNLDYFSSKEVVAEINSLSKSMLKKTSSTTKTDVPELIFQYLVIITGIMFIADWRIRL